MSLRIASTKSRIISNYKKKEDMRVEYFGEIKQNA